MDIEEFLKRQERLQRKMGEASGVTKSPYDMSPEELAEFITWNVTALMAELGEMLQEVGWKPWASDRDIINGGTPALQEMVDAWHFFLNILLALGSWSKRDIDNVGDFFTNYYREKNDKNLRRQIEGYDGRSDKCPQCHREMDIIPRNKQAPMWVPKPHAPWEPDTIMYFCTMSCATDYKKEKTMDRSQDEGGMKQDLPIFRQPEGAKVDMNPAFPRDPEAPMGEVLKVVDPDEPNPHAAKMVRDARITGEPLFCFRARDFFSIQIIAYYSKLVEDYGPDDAAFHANIVDALADFKEWQKSHTDQVRYPD